MGTFLLALTSLPVTASIASVVTLAKLGPLEIRLQAAGSSDEAWQRGLDAPGERVYFLSLLFGAGSFSGFPTPFPSFTFLGFSTFTRIGSPAR
jgi:hypothetical protein